MSHVRIFDNPKGEWLGAGNYPPIVLSGTFAEYNTAQAYESRVQISGHVGNCAVFLDSETNLPPGYTLTVDNDTDEVVLRWPAYQVLSVTEADIPNAGFELGDNGDWVKGYLWQIGAYAANQVYEGTKSAQFSQGEKSITSRINAAHPRACTAGTSVTASCQVQQGQSDAGNAGAWVWIEFLDSNGDVLTHTEGNHVTSGSNSAWHQSSVTAVAPTNTVSARIGAEAFRNRHQDYNLWVDDFQWDLPPEVDDYVGTNETNTINLCLHVVDSLGRTAEECYVIEAYVEFSLLALNPVGYWKLDESSGTVAYDSSGHGYHGTYRGTQYTHASAISTNSSGSLSLTGYGGGGSGVTIPHNVALNVGSDTSWSLCATVKRGTTGYHGSYSAIVNKYSSEETGKTNYALNLNSGNTSIYGVNGAPTVTAKSSPVVGETYRIWIVRNGTTLKSYRDGVLISTTSGIPLSTVGYSSTHTLCIGTGTKYPTSYQFYGNISDVAIFDYAVDEANIVDDADWFAAL